MGSTELPVELWWEIFSYLDVKNLCRVSLVCHQFFKLASTPSLWSEARVSQSCLERLGLSNLFTQQRLSRVRDLDLSYLNLVEENVKTLRGLVYRFRRIRLRYTVLTEQQKLVILQSCLKSTLTELDLDSIDLSQVHSDLLTKSLLHSQVTSLGLNNTNLTGDQLSHLLANVPTSSLDNRLTLSGLNLTSLTQRSLCYPVYKVKILDLANTSLTQDQLDCLMAECLWSTSIESLDLTGHTLTNTPPQLLVDTISCLDSLSLCSALVPPKQLTAMLNSLCLDHSTVENLSLACLDLTEVSANILARSLPTIHKLNLNHCHLTTQQLTTIIRCLTKSNHIVKLELASLDLSQLSASLLARLVTCATQLVSLNLNHTKLTVEQIIGLLTVSSSKVAVLRYLGLARADLTLVPTNILDRALNKINNIKLSFAKLTSDQKILVKARSLQK